MIADTTVLPEKNPGTKKHSSIKRPKRSKNPVTAIQFFAMRSQKRDFRSLWIIRINAAVRENGLTYSKFMSALKKMNIELDRRVLAELAAEDSEAFSNLVSLAKENAA